MHFRLKIFPLLSSRPSVFLFIFLITFRGTFAELGIVNAANFLIALTGLLALLGKMPSALLNFRLLNIYIIYLLIISIFSVLFSPVELLTIFAGLFTLCFFLAYWDVVLRSVDPLSVIKFMYAIGVLNALGALIHKFISADLFGLVYHSVYTQPSIVQSPEVTERAVSFLSSPQNLSLYLSVCLVLTPRVFSGWFCSSVFLGLFSYAILITESKAPVLFIFCFILFILIFGRISPYSIFGFFAVGCLATFMVHERLVTFFRSFLSGEKYAASDSWAYALRYPESLLEFFFGSGIGVASRAAKTLSSNNAYQGSSESFFLQVFVEAGFVGSVFLCLLIVVAIFRFKSYDPFYGAILFSLVVVGFFVPTLYGLSSAVYFYFFLVLGMKKISCNSGKRFDL